MKTIKKISDFLQGPISDYFPQTLATRESGIHAKLNYQVIADRQTRKLSILMAAIVTFSITFVLFLWFLSTHVDVIITNKDLDAYDQWMNSIESHGITNAEMEEENTKMYWFVYFIRFISVRLFIAFTLVFLLSFLIKVYLRTRLDRANNIQKEEALSTIHYFARGEWRLAYDEQGRTSQKGGRLAKIDLDGDAALTTRELLKVLPIKDLFAIPIEGKAPRKGAGDEGIPEKISSLLFLFEELLREIRNEDIMRNRNTGRNDILRK